MNIKKILVILWAGVRSIPINFKLFPLKIALRFPIIISPFVKIKSLKGKIVIKNCDIKPGMIRIGFGNIGIFDQILSRSILEIRGEIIFYGKAVIGHGSKISVGKNGILEIGNNFNVTAETSIVCHKYIKFGDNFVNDLKNIDIGNNVWIGCRNTILKGSRIMDNSVIGANSLVNKEFKKENVLIAGNPAKILKENIIWEK